MIPDAAARPLAVFFAAVFSAAAFFTVALFTVAGFTGAVFAGGVVVDVVAAFFLGGVDAGAGAALVNEP